MRIYNLTLSETGFIGCAYCPQNHYGTAVLVVTGSDGGLTNAQYIAELFAQRGITALALAYFKYPGLNDTLELISLEYMERAAQWLKGNMQADKIALYGDPKVQNMFCLRRCDIHILIVSWRLFRIIVLRKVWAKTLVLEPPRGHIRRGLCHIYRCQEIWMPFMLRLQLKSRSQLKHYMNFRRKWAFQMRL